MALHRGIQSAIFYYLSCAPCSDARYRKKRKQEAQRDRADRELLEAQMPDLYRHPSPSSTNPYWQAEIALGPQPVSRNGKNRKTPTGESQRGGNGNGNGVLRTSATQSSNASMVASSVDVARTWSSPEYRNESTSSFAQHQRDDEPLWGVEEERNMPYRNRLRGSSNPDEPIRPAKARTRDPTIYEAPYNPTINDQHPATVTKVKSQDDIAWMLQPPPVADVMSGKRPPPSRSGTTSSRRSAHSAGTSQRGSNRVEELRLPTGSSLLSTASLNSNILPAQGQRHDRDTRIEERDFATVPETRGRRRPRPLEFKNASEDSELTVLHRPSVVPEPIRIRRAASSRPQLTTIMSDNITSATASGTEFFIPAQKPKENSLPSRARQTEADASSSDDRDRISRRLDMIPGNGADTPIRLLRQDLGPKTPATLHTRIFASTPGAGPEGRLRIPAAAVEGGSEEVDERRLTGGPELFDSWYTPDFELSEWVHEYTKRDRGEVRHRWSMDI
ncbi:hypothetical protein LTR78_007832 [Recurvomyces mirabilis]|uniref:Uncharacterized protein n=1 Tax=Recurvomyces mirabilis TaxID=574656 RepID=A0AAE0TRQ3_9PEZI|nr:hypothetical protein LTR78_007832 [Recurvomyces mirabilis]KAK5160126.1 hypothetical protein LTS14_002233 [Recurvomyces mirabilis]